MRSLFVGQPQQIKVHRVRIRVQLDGLLEIRDRIRILSPPHVNQPQPAMRHRQCLVFRARELLLRDRFRLRHRRDYFQRPLRVLLRFIQPFDRVWRARIERPWNRLPQDRQRLPVIRVQRNFLFAGRFHLLHVPDLQVCHRQVGENRAAIAAIRVLLQERLAQLDTLFRVGVHVKQCFVRRVLFRVHGSRRRCAIQRQVLHFIFGLVLLLRGRILLLRPRTLRERAAAQSQKDRHQRTLHRHLAGPCHSLFSCFSLWREVPVVVRSSPKFGVAPESAAAAKLRPRHRLLIRYVSQPSLRRLPRLVRAAVHI